jgi:hypothetical protein
MVPSYFSPGAAVFSTTVLLSTAICARAARGAATSAMAVMAASCARRFRMGNSYGVLIRVNVTTRV